MACNHIPVLLKEVTSLLLQEGRSKVLVDATFGSGSHTRDFFEHGIKTVYAIDRDIEAVNIARQLSHELCEQNQSINLVPIHGPFSQMTALLKQNGVRPGTVDGVLMDLGTSALQLKSFERGFSFFQDGPLDMRMDRSQTTTARDLLHVLSEEQLADLFWKYGEERLHKMVAKAVVKEREKSSIDMTLHLAAVVEKAIGWPMKRKMKDGLNRRIHPATRVFQALRIAVNNELEELVQGLLSVGDVLKDGGRLLVITFQSLEDRIVKHFMAGQCSHEELLSLKPKAHTSYRSSRRNCLTGGFPVPERGTGNPPHPLSWTVRPLHKKVITACREEVLSNPRARSAKLRTAIVQHCKYA